MVEVITEDDVTSELTRRKIGALGDGSILQWLRDNREKILKVVEFFFSILTLIKVTDEPTEETPTE